MQDYLTELFLEHFDFEETLKEDFAYCGAVVRAKKVEEGLRRSLSKRQRILLNNLLDAQSEVCERSLANGFSIGFRMRSAFLSHGI